MATQTIENAEEHVTVRRRGFAAGRPMRMAWGAIFGGTVATLGIWALLYALGLALGLTAIDPEHPDTARASGIFAGIWSLVVPLIALFIGGAIAGRGAGFVTRMGGAIHGLVMWALTTLVSAWVIANLLGAVVGGVATVGQAADASGKVLWGLFGALFLGLISSMLGAMIGVSRRQAERARPPPEPVLVVTETTPSFPQQPLHQ